MSTHVTPGKNLIAAAAEYAADKYGWHLNDNFYLDNRTGFLYVGSNYAAEFLADAVMFDRNNHSVERLTYQHLSKWHSYRLGL